jgi:hypothetical protein
VTPVVVGIGGVEHAVRRFAPHLYRGVRDEGFTVGLS